MLRNGWVALAALGFLPGCIDESPRPAEGPTETAGDEIERTSVGDAGPAKGTESDLHSFNEAFQRTTGGFSTPVSTHASGTNCVMISEGVDRVLNGTVRATWSPETPLAERLEIVAAGEGPWQRTTGISPLELVLGPLEPEPGQYGGLAFLVQLPDGGAAVEQSVSFEIAFTYLGIPSLEPDPNWGCTYS